MVKNAHPAMQGYKPGMGVEPSLAGELSR